MDEHLALTLLKQDLQRMGPLPRDESYLLHLLRVARANLTQRQGIVDDGSEDYVQLVVGTAAWMYRKRITGEAEPAYVRRLRKDLLLARTRGKTP